MKCGEAAAILGRLVPSGAGVQFTGTEEDAFRELLQQGFIAQVEATRVDPAESMRLRRELADAAGQEADLRRSLANGELSRGRSFQGRRSLEDRLEAILADQRGLRTRILTLAERDAAVESSVAVNGQRYIVTFRGKEFLSRLGPRLQRVSRSSVEEFEGALARLRQAFSSRAARASEILRSLAPAVPGIDEIHLRSAAVGLAVRDDPPEALVGAYRAAVRGFWAPNVPFGPESVALEKMRPLVAEVLCTSGPSLIEPAIQQDLKAFTDLWQTIAKNAPTFPEDAMRAGLMLFPLRDSRERVLQEALSFGSAVREVGPTTVADVATSVLLVQSSRTENPTLVPRYAAYFQALRMPSVPEKDVGLSSALLTVGGGPDPSAAIRRFELARDYLSRFNGGGMAVPAAMLAILSAEIEESLDNLRMASAEIGNHRLSLGGMENLSLGMKLLLQTAIVPNPVRGIVSPQGALVPESQPSAAPTAPLGLLGVAFASPLLLLPALAAFHETALHRLAVSDFAFHPVHTNFVYG
ncbi:MAG: hypothetical protein E6K17_05370 [Methanobacteriota archaeon]|nr:MAG: hypothetical protein E6K17_05370 [Euryarchaeota archaeon]